MAMIGALALLLAPLGGHRSAAAAAVRNRARPSSAAGPAVLTQAAVHSRTRPVIRHGILYRRVDGERLLLDEYLPSVHGRRPAVVFVHGGGFRSGSRDEIAPGEQPVAPLALRLMRRGFAVFAIDYRLAPRFRFPAAADDVLAAVRFVRAHAPRLRVDPRRIALFGASAGGNLAVLAALRSRGSLDRGSRVRAAVSWSGPMDLTRFYPAHPFVSEYVGCVPAACAARYRAASPVTHVDRGDPPVLLVNGSTEIVPLAQAKEMARRLASGDVPHRLLVVAGSRHAGEYADTVLDRTLGFLARHLQGRTER